MIPLRTLITPVFAADAYGCCTLSSGRTVTVVRLQGNDRAPCVPLTTGLSWQSP